MTPLTPEQKKSNLEAYAHAMDKGSIAEVEICSIGTWVMPPQPRFYINECYRLKPSPTYRPWKDASEVPLGKAIRSKESKTISLITGYDPETNEIHCYSQWRAAQNLLDENELLDGSPCGVRE